MSCFWFWHVHEGCAWANPEDWYQSQSLQNLRDLFFFPLLYFIHLQVLKCRDKSNFVVTSNLLKCTELLSSNKNEVVLFLFLLWANYECSVNNNKANHRKVIRLFSLAVIVGYTFLNHGKYLSALYTHKVLSNFLHVFICAHQCIHCVQCFWMLMSIYLLVLSLLITKVAWHFFMCQFIEEWLFCWSHCYSC